LFGFEVARVVLGHEDVSAEQLHAEADRKRGIEVMRQIG
jgi:hypothetical protein